MGQGISLKSERNNPRFNILLHTQSILCATVDSQCLEYLGYITLVYSYARDNGQNFSSHDNSTIAKAC